jgi:ABC-2 type transport system permease protein
MTLIRSAVAVARREWRMQLGSALGWSVMAAFAALAGTVFAVAVFRSGAPATLRGTFIALGWAVLLVAPAISMRSVVEERRNGTWSSLAASPVGFAAIISGKFAALLALLALTITVPVLAQLAALEWFARPDYLEACTGVIGLLLAGSAYLASGILMSALVGNQVAAYLLTVFLWLTWIAIARSAPALLSGNAAYVGFAIDPLRRLDDFLLGLMDTGNVVYFTAIAAWFLCAAAVVVARASLAARVAGRGRIALGLTCGAVIAVASVGMADAPRLRMVGDMTKSRAYTLSSETSATLGALDGDWQIAVILSAPDAGVARQVDEVLARIAECPTADGHIRATRIDPTQPADAARYEAALETVQSRDASALQQHAEAIRAGRAAFDRLTRVAAVQAPLLEDLVTALPAQDPARAELDALRGGFVQLVIQKRAFDRSIEQLRSASDARPFPDEARAAAAIAANLKHWSEELAAAARALADRAAQRVDSAALAAWLTGAPGEFTALARELRVAQDGLDRLPKLWGAEVGAALATGDCAIITGPSGVATVPAWQLVAGASGGSISFDRRFRGEQAIASALRALKVGKPPVVVFVHAGALGILRPSADGSDLAAAADALRGARFEVREWTPADGPQPAVAAGTTIVWIIVPPADRDSVDESPRERALLSVARRLVAQGEPVLLSVGPSLLPLLGQQDPWGALLRGRGMAAQTGRTVLELVPTGPDRAETSAVQTTVAGGIESAVGRAIDGQRLRLDRPIPLESDPAAAGVSVVVGIEPAAERWIEDDWRRDLKGRMEAPESKRFDAEVPVVLVSDAPRAMLVGSPTWMTTAVADSADALGGGRIALRNPGNRDLLVNAVAWLAGRDDLLAGSGAGREVGRLPRLSRATVGIVGSMEAFAVPALIAALGAWVVVRRRMRT